VYHRIIAEIDYHGMEGQTADEGVEVPIDRPLKEHSASHQVVQISV